MSRIGKKPIVVPQGVEVKVENGIVKVKGPKGQLEQSLHRTTKLAVDKGLVKVELAENTKLNRKYHGLVRSLVANMVEGVSTGYRKQLTLIGVGYRAQMKGSDLNLTLGFSHPILFKAPAGIDIKVEKNTTVIISGADKQSVGQVAANIRGFRPPEPYHGKGVRYSDERIITKVGKAGGK